MSHGVSTGLIKSYSIAGPRTQLIFWIAVFHVLNFFVSPDLHSHIPPDLRAGRIPSCK